MKNASSFWRWLLCDWLGWHDMGFPREQLIVKVIYHKFDGRCLRCRRNLISAVEIKDEKK